MGKKSSIYRILRLAVMSIDFGEMKAIGVFFLGVRVSISLILHKSEMLSVTNTSF